MLKAATSIQAGAVINTPMLRQMSEAEIALRCKAEMMKDKEAARRYREYFEGYESQIGQMRAPEFRAV